MLILKLFSNSYRFFILSLCIFCFSSFSFAKTVNSNVCEHNILDIEQQIDIPRGLLKAIGLTESGRYINKSKFVIWPWTINTNKKSLFFDTKKQMLKFLMHETKNGNFNLDVGCMQINLKWHGKYFKKISDSVDPKINISYATSFLYKLKSDFKTWNEAIKRYHSSKPSKNIRYHKKVLANWSLVKKSNEKTMTVKNTLKSHIEKNQPNLLNSYKKIMLFRKIFMEKNNN